MINMTFIKYRRRYWVTPTFLSGILLGVWGYILYLAIRTPITDILLFSMYTFLLIGIAIGIIIMWYLPYKKDKKDLMAGKGIREVDGHIWYGK